VFKIILQEFINCAHDSTKIFDLMQDGDSTSYIRCMSPRRWSLVDVDFSLFLVSIVKTANRTERKYLPRIETEDQLWDNIKLMCKSFSINESLFLKKKIPKKRINKPINGSDKDDKQLLNDNHTLTCSQKTDSFMENLNEHKRNFNLEYVGFYLELISKIFSFPVKRRSSGSTNEPYPMQHKMIKSDFVDNPYLWNPEQVGNYIMQADPNLMPYVGVFKYQVSWPSFRI
jgi:hypothetical protein